MESNGELIVIEGIDGAGKTTVSDYLCENFGYSYMTQPEDSWVGEAARRGLSEDIEPACDLFLHLAAHANQQARLKDELQADNVVMDRYYHSRVSYQAVQSDFSPEEILEFHSGWTVEPSKVIILDLPAERALERKNESTDKFEKVEFLTEVRSMYKKSFDGNEDVHLIDADRPKCEVLDEVDEIQSNP